MKCYSTLTLFMFMMIFHIQGESGTCSYIHSDKCQDVKRNLFNPSRREQVIQYILRAIQSPCGFAFFDFTLCCSDDSR